MRPPPLIRISQSLAGYCHRLVGFHDPIKVIIMEMLKAYGKLDFRVDRRLPVTLPILKVSLRRNFYPYFF